MSENVVKGGVAARINHLRMTHENPVYSLPGMEAHGKRHDATSKARAVGDKPPLVYGSLDLQDAFETHVEGALMSAACKAPVLHCILQWPVDLPLPDEAAEQLMLRRSIDFMNRTLGGDAVFAARLDRDESGRHTVDVFATPKYMKKTKDGERLWVSTSKHLKALCQKHLVEIKARYPKVKNPDSMKCQGIALNSEFHEFVTSLGMKPKRKVEKNHSVPDRVSPETYAAAAEARKTIEAGHAMDIALKARERALEASKADFVEFQRVERENAAKAVLEATRGREEALARREAAVKADERQLGEWLADSARQREAHERELVMREGQLAYREQFLERWAEENGVEPPTADPDYRP
jgi:hypothetical protein